MEWKNIDPNYQKKGNGNPDSGGLITKAIF